MSKSKTVDTPKRKRAPAKTPEARENQMINLAVDLAEKQLLDGTASSQVITHYLKLGSTKEAIEKDILKEEVKLVKARTENLESDKRKEEMYAKALAAMRTYSGNGEDEDYD